MYVCASGRIIAAPDDFDMELTGWESTEERLVHRPHCVPASRNGTLLMLVLTLTIGAVAVPTVHELGGSIRETLYRNYVSIEAAHHMHATLYAVELAKLQAGCRLRYRRAAMRLRIG